jgi:hypothetical protein
MIHPDPDSMRPRLEQEKINLVKKEEKSNTTTLVPFYDVLFMSPNLKFLSLFEVYGVSVTTITSSPIMCGIA